MITLNYTRVMQETDDAWMIEFGSDFEGPKGARCVWLPKSECHHHPSVCEIEVPEWLVIEKELDDYSE